MLTRREDLRKEGRKEEKKSTSGRKIILLDKKKKNQRRTRKSEAGTSFKEEPDIGISRLPVML